MKKLILFFATMPLHAMEEEVHLDAIYQSAGQVYQELSPDMQNKNLESGDIITTLGKIYTEVMAKNPEEAMKWYCRFTERIALDYKWLSFKQKEVYCQLDTYIDDKVMSIQPQPIKDMRPTKRMRYPQIYALHWLRHIIENNICSGLTWPEILAQSVEPIMLSPKTLRAERLKTLDTYGTLQTMSSNKQ